MKRFFLTVLAAILMAVSLHAADKIYKLQSPSGELSVEISAGKELRWSVEMQGVNILEPSTIAMTLEDGTVFGKDVKGREVFIKITLGYENGQTICISFHLAEYPLKYPFK